MNITEWIKYEKLEKENEALNSKIRTLKEENEALKKELAELKQQQLYKEDFKEFYYCINCVDKLSFDRCRNCDWKRIIDLKDNSKYNKLLSKDVKYEKVK
ncbi:hypothetical protein [Spiroplasma phoeniceum]|uniref:Uncharacterized protein n=1 Tax=Spiroplasma phoeniceum P40 TaxID=1276259 RepID=A0A345DLE7_9MOLU|nr:hypothetical protein [Spiroplasma phoeniceum]AXF95035.1 hypothetical protein SDAV_0019 [Spiroplasma phoeniceum P40]